MYKIFFISLFAVVNIFAKTTPEQNIKMMADYYNAKIPLKIDKYTTMIDTSVKNRNLVFLYRLDVDVKYNVQKEISKKHIAELSKVCNSDSGKRIYYNDGASITHMYYDDKHNLLRTSVIDKKNCELYKTGNIYNSSNKLSKKSKIGFEQYLQLR